MTVETFEDAYRGERLFLLGNGPSLAETPLRRLEDEYTFGVNNITNIFDETTWRPSFYMAIHGPPSVPEANVREIVDLDVTCFFPKNRVEYVEDRPNVERIPLRHLESKPDVHVTDYRIDWDSFDDIRAVWSTDVADVVYHYTTILYPVMQLADYMGFSEMYLLGCDLYPDWDLHMIFEDAKDPGTYHSASGSKLKRVHEFLSEADRPIRSAANGVAYHALDSVAFRKAQPVLRRLDDRFSNQAHFYDTFDVGHFLAGGRLLNEKIIRSHELAKVAASEFGFSLENATLGGSLEVHPRVDLDELLD